MRSGYLVRSAFLVGISISLAPVAMGCGSQPGPDAAASPSSVDVTSRPTASAASPAPSAASPMPSASGLAATTGGTSPICPSADACKGSASSRLDALESHEKDAAAEPFLRRACDLGERESCVRLARLEATRFFGAHDAPNLPGAIDVATKACDAKATIETCAAAAAWLRRAGDDRWHVYATKTCALDGITPPRLVECANETLATGGIPKLEATCRDEGAGDIVSCDVLLDALAPGSKTADAAKRSKLERDLAKRAAAMCKSPPFQCATITTLMIDGAAPADPEILDGACGWGVEKACTFEISSLVKAKKFDQAAAATAGPCRDDMGTACAAIARMAASKQVSSPDLPAALYLAERACYLDDRECDAVADVTDAMAAAHAPAVGADPADALARACKAGKKAACTRKPKAP